jgi:DNA-binding MarR family transcriptional regulator
MQAQLTALLNRELATDGLSFQDYLVLAELSDRPDGRARFNELATELGWEKSRASHHLARMESRGLIERVRCETDQRGWFASLTKQGKATIKAAAPAHVNNVRAHFIDLLSERQIATLDTVARTVLEHLHEA